MAEASKVKAIWFPNKWSVSNAMEKFVFRTCVWMHVLWSFELFFFRKEHGYKINTLETLDVIFVIKFRSDLISEFLTYSEYLCKNDYNFKHCSSDLISFYNLKYCNITFPHRHNLFSNIKRCRFNKLHRSDNPNEKNN